MCAAHNDLHDCERCMQKGIFAYGFICMTFLELQRFRTRTNALSRRKFNTKHHYQSQAKRQASTAAAASLSFPDPNMVYVFPVLATAPMFFLSFPPRLGDDYLHGTSLPTWIDISGVFKRLLMIWTGEWHRRGLKHAFSSGILNKINAKLVEIRKSSLKNSIEFPNLCTKL